MKANVINYEGRMLDEPYDPVNSSYALLTEDSDEVPYVSPDEVIERIGEVWGQDGIDVMADNFQNMLNSIVLVKKTIEYEPLTPEQKKRIVDVMRSNPE